MVAERELRLDQCELQLRTWAEDLEAWRAHLCRRVASSTICAERHMFIMRCACHEECQRAGCDPELGITCEGGLCLTLPQLVCHVVQSLGWDLRVSGAFTNGPECFHCYEYRRKRVTTETHHNIRFF